MFLSKVLVKNKELCSSLKMSFGAGPYNPYRYKDYFVPRNLPKTQEIEDYVKSVHSVPASPIRNVRHVNPVRQSGPIPAYDGAYTMEDIRNVMWNTCVGRDFHYCQTDVDEIMRRVPGITRKECEHIVKLGLSPAEQVDFAYLAKNIGLDVFYLTNQCFVARQVVTNSKGEKVEVLWNAQSFEDLALLNVGFAPVLENVDYHWEIFLWGDPPIKAQGDIDLNVPNTWFEYECEWWNESSILEDQFNMPEDLRVQSSPRNPHARRELWRSQDDLQETEQLKQENWYPKNTSQNIYRQESFQKPSQQQQNTIY